MQGLMIRIGKTAAIVVVLVAFVATGAVVAGCNTTEGLGKDIKSAGKGIEETASDAKK